MGTKLYVGNLPWSMDDQALSSHFAGAGAVTSAVVIRECGPQGRSKGFGFVEFATPEEAQKAVEMYHEQDCGGRNLIVNEARPQQPREDRRW